MYYTEMMGDSDSIRATPVTRSLRRDFLIAGALTALGFITARVNVTIPGSQAIFDLRWVFGYVAFAFVGRWWLALIVAIGVSFGPASHVGLLVALIGNMLYALPELLLLRTIHHRLFAHVRSVTLYAVGWGVAVIVGYQLFTTPVVWGVLAYLENRPILPGVASGWVEQLLVAVISALMLVVLRDQSHKRISAERGFLSGESTGATIIRSLAEHQLQGNVEFVTGDDGRCCVLRFQPEIYQKRVGS